MRCPYIFMLDLSFVAQSKILVKKNARAFNLSFKILNMYKKGPNRLGLFIT